MDTKDIIGLVIGLGILGNSALNTWQNNYLKNKVNELETVALYNKAILKANKVKEAEYQNQIDDIERNHNEEVNDINNTPIGGTINF